MPIGTTAAILLGVGAAGAGYGISKMIGNSVKDFGEKNIPMPKAPDVQAAQDKSKDIIKRKKSAMSQTVYSSPLGVSGTADVVKKTLLGQ